MLRCGVPVNATHREYDVAAPDWARVRDVLAGEDAVRAAGAKYLPRLDSQSEDEFAAYVKRASFFNATARTAEGYVGQIFRRAPFIKTPPPDFGVGRALADFVNDADMLGTSLFGYAKNVVTQVIAVGRAGTLLDWEGEFENRVYAWLYPAEQIINWRVERVNGRNVPTLVVLREKGRRLAPVAASGADEFVAECVEQIRVLKLVATETLSVNGKTPLLPCADPAATRRNFACVVELWQPKEPEKKTGQREWLLVQTCTPLRLGKPLPLIPFVFHGSRNSLPAVDDKLPLADILAVNLDHYRLDADYKYGLHFTALPTAWVTGFDKSATLRIGASTAWVSETPGATAGQTLPAPRGGFSIGNWRIIDYGLCMACTSWR